MVVSLISFSFFFNDTATTQIYTLSLHDALPISRSSERIGGRTCGADRTARGRCARDRESQHQRQRSEEHTSELQSLTNLVCRLLLEKKKKKKQKIKRHQKQKNKTQTTASTDQPL